MPNMEALDRAMTHIIDHPEQHKQSSWTCETGACLAGWGVMLNGYVITPFGAWVTTPEHRVKAARLAWEIDDLRKRITQLEDEDLYDAGLAAQSEALWAEFKEICVDVRSKAIELFDIDNDTAKVLFDGTNSADTLRLMVKDLGNGEKLTDHWDRSVSALVYERID